MTGGRPRTAIGTYAAVYVMRTVYRCVAETRVRDLDGRLRKVSAPQAREIVGEPRVRRPTGWVATSAVLACAAHPPRPASSSRQLC